MPPPCRNQRAPTAGDTPTTTAASSDDTPAAICFQNSRSTLRLVFGAPGEIIAERPVNSFNHPAGRPINTPRLGVLRPPVESAQYTSLAFTEALTEAGITGSIGSVGDALDNALMESSIGLFKTEVIDHERDTWSSWRQVEQATVEWVHWYNHERLHSSIGDIPPVEHEDTYYHSTQRSQQPAAA